jgi:DNA-binding Lrp family transcriptional regulator
MHPQTVFAKTAKGVLEIRNKTIKLPRDLGLVFLAVDGKSTIGELAQKAGLPGEKLEEALDKLATDGYIKIFSSPAPVAAAAATAAAQDVEDDLDFTSPQAVAKLNAEAETRLKAEAEAKARALTAARAAAEAKIRQETEAQRRKRVRKRKSKRSSLPKRRRERSPRRGRVR